MDMVTRVTRFPDPGETITGTEFRTVPGGKGANQAIAAARLGARVSMIGRVGPGAFGTQLLDNLKTAGVDHTFVAHSAESATGTATILVDDAGQNNIIVVPGANGLLSPADVEAAEPAIAGSDVMLLQLEIPLETVLRAVALGRRHGVKVALNPAPARPLPAELLSSLDVLVPNESETALLTGMPVSSHGETVAAARALLGMGVGAVVLTLGEAGAMWARADQVSRVPAFQVTPVDTTAAGDAFTAGLAVALAEGRSLDDAVRWANAAGALATTRLGAQPSLPTRAAVDELVLEGATRTV